MSAVREFPSVTLTNNSNLVQINTNHSNFSVVPGSVIFIAGDRPRVVTSGDTVNRTLTLSIAYIGDDITEKSATLVPLGSNDHLLSALTMLSDAQHFFNESFGVAGSNLELIDDAGATQTISKIGNAIVDITLTQAVTEIICSTRPDKRAHTVTLILRQGAGENRVEWVGVTWAKSKPPYLRKDEAGIDVIELIVTEKYVLGTHKAANGGGWNVSGAWNANSSN